MRNLRKRFDSEMGVRKNDIHNIFPITYKTR